MKGSIRKRGNTYTVRWSTIDPATGNRREHSKAGFVRKEPARPTPKGDSAREYLNSIIGSVSAGEWRPDKKMTVGQLMTEWLAAHRSDLADGTAAMYENCIKWLEPIGALPLEHLTAQHARDLAETLRSPTGSRLGRGALSDRSVQLALSKLKSATRWAAENDYIARDPLRAYRKPKAEASSAATQAWTVEEANRFLHSPAVAGDRLRAMWWLFLSRGPRRGELAGLRWPKVDLDNAQVRILETRVMVDSQAARSLPKTDAGRRPIPLDPVLVAELRRHKVRQIEERMRVGGEAWADTGFVFTDELGQPLPPQWISRRFEQLAKKAGVRRIRLHDARHTAGTLMILSGIDSKVVAEILGHSSDAITRRIYLHVLPGMGAEAGASYTRLLAGEAN